MGGLIGFGSTPATTIWTLATFVAVCWVGRQLLKRRPVTVISYVVLFAFVLPILLQYPFVFSPINGLTIGPENYASYRSHIDAALLITVLGIAMFVAGYVVAGPGQPHFAPMTIVAAGIRSWSQGVFLYLSSVFILLLFALLLGFGLLGAGGARNITQAVPALRPFYNVAHVLLPLIIALDLLVGVQRGRRMVLVLAIANVGLGLLTGARAVALGGILLFALTALTYESLLERLKLARAVKLVPIAMGLLVAAVYLADVREGQYNIALTVATLGAKLFYGNNFSDLRDFAWVRSYWNGEYFLGKTQIAGLLAFIPSAVSSFREQWNLGVVTASITGLDPRVHPGLRTGPFGEMYFNFGLFGVVLAGLLYGYIVRRVHNATLAAARTLPRQEALTKIFAGFVTVGLAGSLLNTAGFFGFYLTVGILVGLQLFDYMLRAVRADAPRVLPSGMRGASLPQ